MKIDTSQVYEIVCRVHTTARETKMDDEEKRERRKRVIAFTCPDEIRHWLQDRLQEGYGQTSLIIALLKIGIAEFEKKHR